MKQKENDQKNGLISQYALILFALLFYSASSLCIKFASGYPTLSVGFVLCYGTAILILVIYAVLWQAVLKRVELSRAYAMKPLTMVISMFWGLVLFQEQITWNMVLGVAIILVGIRMAVSSNDE